MNTLTCRRRSHRRPHPGGRSWERCLTPGSLPAAEIVWPGSVTAAAALERTATVRLPAGVRGAWCARDPSRRHCGADE